MSQNDKSVVVAPRKKSFWRMVRSMLIPTRVFTTIISCGGTRGKRLKRMEKIRRGDFIPRDRSSREFDNQIPPPTEIIPITTELETTLQNLVISPPDNCSENQISNLNNIDDVTNSNRNNSDENPVSQNEANLSNITDTVADVHVEISGDDSIINSTSMTEEVVVRRRKKFDSAPADDSKFHGWRKSSIEVAPMPPTTLKWIPSGLQIGDKVMWITDNQPERAIVRWIGKIRDMFYAGIEFERQIGNSSGIYGYGLTTYQRLFTCDLGFGRFVPVDQLVLYSDFHDKGLKAGFICVICRDDFLELPDYHAAGDGQMVATKCGHLYHQFCLTQWFSSSKQLCHHCPHCQHVIEIDDIIRLFPAQV